MGLSRRSEQRPSDQAICARAAGHGGFQSSQYRVADSVISQALMNSKKYQRSDKKREKPKKSACWPFTHLRRTIVSHLVVPSMHLMVAPAVHGHGPARGASIHRRSRRGLG